MRSVTSTPTSSHGGRPAANASSMTHWRNGSATTGQRSSMPMGSRSQLRSASSVTGVMRSTIELGNDVLLDPCRQAGVERARPRDHRRAAASPLPGRLSQLRTVSGPAPVRGDGAPARRPADRRSGSAAWRARPSRARVSASVIVSDKIAVSGAAISSAARCRRPLGACTKPTIEPMTVAVRLAGALLDQGVEVVLRAECVRHLGVAVEEAEPGDAPVGRSRRARAHRRRGGRGGTRRHRRATIRGAQPPAVVLRYRDAALRDIGEVRLGEPEQTSEPATAGR